jgi:hypothetical protein
MEMHSSPEAANETVAAQARFLSLERPSGGNLKSCRRFAGLHGSAPMDLSNVVTIQPIVALVAGVLILLAPRLLNYIVAIWLIIFGITGLAPHV